MLFNSFILILTVALFKSSNCLDVYHPAYAQNAPLTGYTQPNQYQNPHQSGIYYQDSSLNEAYHHDLDYHRGQSQQNYGQITRRSLPPFTQARIVPCPHKQAQQSSCRCHRSIPIPYYPQYPHCKTHDYLKDNFNNEEESFPQQERDYRSAPVSSTSQSDSLNSRSPVYIPKYSTIESTNKTISKRSIYSPFMSDYVPANRTNNSNDMSHINPATTDIPLPMETSPTFLETLIVGPSKKLAKLNNTSSNQSLRRSNFPRDHNIFINYPRDQFNSNTQEFDKFNNDKMFMDDSHFSGSTEAGVQNNFPTYQSYIESQKSLRNFPITSDFRFVNSKQTLDSFKQPILSYEASDVSRYPDKRAEDANSARFADYFSLSSPPLAHNNNEHVNYKPNMVRNNSRKSLLSESSRKLD